MRVLLDTNVLFAALLANGLCREVFRRVVKLKALVSSPPLLAEFQEIVVRKLPPTPEMDRFLEEFRRCAIMVEPRALPAPVCRDPDDDLVLATALATGSGVIVTGDDDLLVLRQHEGVWILSPRQFLERLDRQTEKLKTEV